MPTYRLIHTNARTGRRTKQLTDLEYLVWLAYLLSSDDYGVCPASARKLQGDDPRLDSKPTKAIQRCLNTLVRVGLLSTFEDGGTVYLYQSDWQDWQKIRYPSTTSYPTVPADHFARLSAKTRAMFDERARNRLSETENRDDDLPTADANANANAHASQKNGTPNFSGGPLIVNSLTWAKKAEKFTFFGSRLRVPHVLHEELRTKLGGENPHDRLCAWYLDINEEAENDRLPIPDVFEFLRPRFKSWAQSHIADTEMQKFLEAK